MRPSAWVHGLLKAWPAPSQPAEPGVLRAEDLLPAAGLPSGDAVANTGVAGVARVHHDQDNVAASARTSYRPLSSAASTPSPLPIAAMVWPTRPYPAASLVGLWPPTTSARPPSGRLFGHLPHRPAERLRLVLDKIGIDRPHLVDRGSLAGRLGGFSPPVLDR
jgi:hypothetical protein